MKSIFIPIMECIADVLSNQSSSGFVFVALLFLLWTLLKRYRIRSRLVRKVNEIPNLKLKWYQVFGHLTIIILKRMFGSSTGASSHVDEFLASIGYASVFQKDGISSLWYFGNPVILVYKASTVETILSSSTEVQKAWFYRFFEPWIGSGLFVSSGTAWKARRKLLAPSFHLGILENFLKVFNKQSQILVEKLQDHSEEYVNILPLASNCSLDIMFESMMGKDLMSQNNNDAYNDSAVEELTRATSIRMQNIWLWNDFLFKLSSIGKRYMKNIKVLHNFTKELIEEKKKSFPMEKSQSMPRKNLKNRALLDLLLLEHMKNNTISERELLEEVNAFAFAGYDTTSLAISWTLYLIGLHPWVQDRIHQEVDAIFGEDDREASMADFNRMEYLDRVIKESLRLYPSAPGFGRTATNDITFLDKYTVPKGSTIYVLSYVLHRDPEYFPNPEKFDPERFTPENSAKRPPFAYVPFSAGPRNCMGKKFSMLEQKAVLSSIFRKLKIRSLDPRDKIQLVHEIVLRPIGELRIQIRRRDQDFDFHSTYYFP